MRDQLQAGTEALVVPMSAPERIRRIAQLHRESKQLLQETTRLLLAHAIEAGELLQQQKDILPHGVFTVWLQHNKQLLGFGERQAQRYMKIARHKDVLLSSEVSTMEDALTLLVPSHRLAQKEKGATFVANTGRSPDLPMKDSQQPDTKPDTGVGFSSSHSIVVPLQNVNNTSIVIDCTFSAREEREIASMIAELGLQESVARQIIAWRKSKKQSRKPRQPGTTLERSTYRLPGFVRRKVQNEAKGRGVSESEILRQIVQLYYPEE